jgi:hypothetical protein
MRILWTSFFAYTYAFTLSAQCTTAGPNNGSASNNNIGTGYTAWINLTNVYLPDNNAASATALTLGKNTDYIMITGFGFSIPATATVNGISVSVRKSASGLLENVQDQSVMIIQNGNIAGTEHASSGAWPLTETFFNYGSTSDLWGLSWAPNDINASNFGISISANLAGLSVLPTAYIDDVQITICYTSVVLPIELTMFDGVSQNNNSVKLSWTTATETDNDYFSIEYAADAMDWKEKGKIKGAGFSKTNQEYVFIDSNRSQTTSYYRLKQTDFNGKSVYLKTISVEPYIPLNPILVYPNPANDFITISSSNTISSIKIFNSSGIVLTEIKYDINENKKNAQIILPKETDMYLLRVTDTQGKTFTKKLMTSLD